jgi:hypothetical protein
MLHWWRKGSFVCKSHSNGRLSALPCVEFGEIIRTLAPTKRDINKPSEYAVRHALRYGHAFKRALNRDVELIWHSTKKHEGQGPLREAPVYIRLLHQKDDKFINVQVKR